MGVISVFLQIYEDLSDDREELSEIIRARRAQLSAAGGVNQNVSHRSRTILEALFFKTVTLGVT